MSQNLPKNPAVWPDGYLTAEVMGSTFAFFIFGFMVTLLCMPFMPDNPHRILLLTPMKGVAAGFLCALVFVAFAVVRNRQSISKIGVRPTVDAILARPMDHANYLAQVADTMEEADLQQLAQAMAKGSAEAQNLAVDVLLPAFEGKLKARVAREAGQARRAKALENMVEGLGSHAGDPSSSTKS